jgi:hypothetical protein
MTRSLIRILATTSLAFAVAPAGAAVVTVTDCSAGPVARQGKRTVVDRPADDVVVQCALLPLDGTQRIEVTARSITIAAGSKGPAIDLTALGTGPDGRSIHVDGGNVTAANPNGNARLQGPGAIEIRRAGLQAGDNLEIRCTGGGCPVTLDEVSTNANDITIEAQGTVTVASSILRTVSPIDRIEVTSATGDVVMTDVAAQARGASRLACRDDVLASCPGPDCPLPVTIASEDDAVLFCDCPDEKPTQVETGIEGNLAIAAPAGSVDLRGASVRVAENIDVRAADTVAMDGASMDNCGPKTGRFTVTAAACTVEQATLRDDEADAQPALSCGVTGTAIAIGSCSAKP